MFAVDKSSPAAFCGGAILRVMETENKSYENKRQTVLFIQIGFTPLAVECGERCPTAEPGPEYTRGVCVFAQRPRGVAC